MTTTDPLAILTPEQRTMYEELFACLPPQEPAAAELLRLATRVVELERIARGMAPLVAETILGEPDDIDR